MKYKDRKLGRPRKGVVQYRQTPTPTIIAKYPGECSRCGRGIAKGEWVRFNFEERTIRHASNCGQKSSKVSQGKSPA